MIARIKSIKRKKINVLKFYTELDIVIRLGFVRVPIACSSTVVISEMLIGVGTSGDFIKEDLNFFESESNKYWRRF